VASLTRQLGIMGHCRTGARAPSTVIVQNILEGAEQTLAFDSTWLRNKKCILHILWHQLRSCVTV